VTGPPGAGKTTTAEILAARAARGVHAESDSFFHAIRAGYIEPWKPESHKQNEDVMRVVASAAADYADAGYFTVVEGIISPRWFFQPLRDALHASGQTVAYVVLRAPLAVCVARAATRERSRLSSASVVEQIWHDFAELGELESHAIDAEQTPANEIADEIARRLRDGGLDV